jgi:ferritin-like metal-binding protein YciE
MQVYLGHVIVIRREGFEHHGTCPLGGASLSGHRDRARRRKTLRSSHREYGYEDLKEEWNKYLDETRTHQEILGRVFGAAGLDIGTESPGRSVVRQKGEALVAAVRAARNGDDPKIAELVAAESVVEAESKNHQNWELLGRMVEHLDGELREALSEAYDEVADQEAHHLFHTMGWARELWLDYLGVPAALPPPEEEKQVATQIGAGRAEKQRDEYV